MNITNNIEKIKAYFTPKRVKVLLVVLGGLLLLGLGVVVYGLSVRQGMLDKAVAKVKTQLKEDYNVDFEVGKYGFSGLTTVRFEQVRVTPDSAERLAAIEDLRVSVRLFPLLSKKIVLDKISLQEASISLVKQDSTANYDFLFRRRGSHPVDTTATQTNLAQLADRLINQAFDKVPNHLDMDRVEVSYRDSSGTQRVHIPEGAIRSGRYDMDVYLNDDDAMWNIAGRIDRSKQEFSVSVSAENPEIALPVLQRKYGLKVLFGQITFDLKDIEREGIDRLRIRGMAEVKDLAVHHHRLSHQDIELPHAVATGGVLISENSLEIVEGTLIEVQDFSFKPQLMYNHAPSKQLQLALHTGRFEAQDFFNAIPKGLFENLEGIEVEGEIEYDMDFNVDFDHPDDLVFHSKIDDKDLKIKKWGNANIADLNTDFVHEVYEDTAKLRDILVGRSNPNFTALGDIAPILRETVMNTEDPFFYDHQGFEEEAFKLSIATNIKEKAFKRGASTISMQLVKNLYLNRNKTMMRKFEEILIVWLMEQSQEVSKDRLLEIYFNIIEWGRNVYGIKEGANYYFGKQPSEINLGESLYLSSIVPRPKTGLSSFDYTGHLKPWVQRHFNTYGFILNRRGLLQNVEVPENYGFYGVVLQPNLRPPRPHGVVDSVATDIHELADEIDREEEQRRTLLERLFGKPSEENEEN